MVWEYAQQAGGVVTAVTAHFQSFARQQADFASADIIRDSALAEHLDVASRTPQSNWRELKISHVTFRHPESRLPALWCISQFPATEHNSAPQMGHLSSEVFRREIISRSPESPDSLTTRNSTPGELLSHRLPVWIETRK